MRITNSYLAAYGKQSDGGTFLASSLYDIFDNYKNSLPLPTKINDTEIEMPYIMFADDAYPLYSYIFKPCSKQNFKHKEIIFNFRISRCRRCVKCASWILCNKWRLLYKPIEIKIEKIKIIAKAINLLHNIIKDLDVIHNACAIEEVTKSMNFK